MSVIDTIPGVARIIATQPTVEIIGPTQTQESVEITAVELKHGVFFQFRVNRAVYVDPAGDVDVLLNFLASEISALMDLPYVLDADPSQEVDAAGHIRDFMDFVVSPDGGTNSAILHQPMDSLEVTVAEPMLSWLVRVIEARLAGQAPPAPPSPQTLLTTGGV